jgi:hypothetical protein
MGALVWPAALGVITAWLLPAMSYYGSLAAAAGGGALIALLLGSRRPVWSVVALTVGAIPGTVLLVQGGRALLGVLGIANGAAPVFFFVLAGLLVLPLVKLVLPTGSTISSAKSIMRQRGFLVPMGALALTVTLASIGIAVDRFDQTHPRQSHLMYVIDADSGTAMWVSHDQEPDAWTAAYVPNRNNSAEPHVPLPYDTTPRWQGPAAALPLKPPRVALLESRSAADGALVKVRVALVKVRVASSRAADVITVHVDRPVETAAIEAAGQPSVSSSPSYPGNLGSRAWPYELRFYDPPPDGFAHTLQSRGVGLPRLYVSDFTVGLEWLPGFRQRPAGLDRSPDHSSDTVVVGRTFRP